MGKISRGILKYILALFGIYVLFGFFILPYLVKTSLPIYLQQKYNISTYIDSVHLNPFDASLRVDNFILKDQQNENLFYFEKLHIDLALFQLLNKTLYVEKFALTNSKATVIINKDQRANYQFLIDTFRSDHSSKVQENNQESFNIFIKEFDVNFLNVAFEDLSKKEVFRVVTKPIDFSLKDFAFNQDHENKIDLDIQTHNSGDITLRSLFIADPLSFEAKVALKDINIDKIYSYLKPQESFAQFRFDRLKSDFELSLKSKNNAYEVGVSNINFQLPQFDMEHKLFTTSLEKLRIVVNNFDLHAIDDTISYNVYDTKIDIQKINLFDKQYGAQHRFSSIESGIKKITSNKKEPIDIVQTLVVSDNGLLNTTIRMIQEPFLVESAITLEKIDLRRYTPYIEKFVNLDIKDGVLSTKSDLLLKQNEKKLDISLHSNMELRKIDIWHKLLKKPILKVDGIDIANLNYTQDNLQIDTIMIDTPDFFFELQKDSKHNLSDLIVKQEEKKDPSQKQGSFEYTINQVELQNGKAKIVDNTITPTFSSTESEVNLLVKNITSKKDQLTHITHSSVVDNYGVLKSQGSLYISDPLKNISLELDLDNLDLLSLSPYSGKFIGNKIDNGKLFLKLDHTIKDNIIDAKNNIRIKDIKLGEKVESKEAIDAPIGLAIALLEDSSGYIDLDLPISGDLQNPKFDISDAIFDVIRNTLVGIVSAPFKLLAMLVGAGDNDELNKSSFHFGKSSIDPTQKQTLDKLVVALQKRPGLKLKVAPSYALKEDTQALIDQKFQSSYKNLLDPTLDIELKVQRALNVYKELYTKEDIEAFEQKGEELLVVLIDQIKKKIEVSQNELENLAFKRASNIKSYLVDKNIESKRVEILEEFTVSDNVDKRGSKVLLKFKL